MKVQSKFVLFSTTFLLAIASNANAGPFDSPKERMKDSQSDIDQMIRDGKTMTGRYARKVGKRDKLAVKVAQREGREDIAGTGGTAEIRTQFRTETRETFPVYVHKIDQGRSSTDQGKTNTDQGTVSDNSGGPLPGCHEPYWTGDEWICKDGAIQGPCDDDKGSTNQGKTNTDQGKTNTDQGKTNTDQGKTGCTDPNTVWNPATNHCDPTKVDCDLTKTEYNPRTNSCDPLPDLTGCDDGETYVEGKGCVPNKLPTPKPKTNPTPVRTKVPPTKKADQGKLPTPKPKTNPTPVRKPLPKKKPTTPVVVTAPCPDEGKLEAANQENERLKQEQKDKDEAARLEQARKDKEHADEVARLKKKADQDNLVMNGKAKLNVNNQFSDKAWDTNSEGWSKIKKSERLKIKVKNPTLGQAKALARMGEDMDTNFSKNVSDIQRKYGIAEDNTAAADAARKSAQANSAN